MRPTNLSSEVSSTGAYDFLGHMEAVFNTDSPFYGATAGARREITLDVRLSTGDRFL